MSLVFASTVKKSQHVSTQETVQKMLEENAQLIQIIYEYQIKGKMNECVEYQKVLHRNIVYLARLSDLCSSSQVSLPIQGAQTGSATGGQVTQIHSSGHVGSLDTGSSDGYREGNLQTQGLNATDHQSHTLLNQPAMSAEHPGNFGQMSPGCIGMDSNLTVQQQQHMMSNEQPVLLHHLTSVSDNSYSLPPLHGSQHERVIQEVGHQDGYHSSAAGQQEYTPQQNFSGPSVELPQYTQLLPSSLTQQNQSVSNQLVQDSSQNYVPYSRQGIIDSEGISQQQPNIIGGAENIVDGAENRAEQQGSVSGCVRELKDDINSQQTDMSGDRNKMHYDMPNLADG